MARVGVDPSVVFIRPDSTLVEEGKRAMMMFGFWRTRHTRTACISLFFSFFSLCVCVSFFFSFSFSLSLSFYCVEEYYFDMDAASIGMDGLWSISHVCVCVFWFGLVWSVIRNMQSRCDGIQVSGR